LLRERGYLADRAITGARAITYDRACRGVEVGCYSRNFYSEIGVRPANGFTWETGAFSQGVVLGKVLCDIGVPRFLRVQ
jgi:hypothetical protein